MKIEALPTDTVSSWNPKSIKLFFLLVSIFQFLLQTTTCQQYNWKPENLGLGYIIIGLNPADTGAKSFPLKVGDTYMAHKTTLSASLEATYFFFSSKLSLDFTQGAVFDSFGASYRSTLLTEDKSLYVGSADAAVPFKLFTLAFDTSSYTYTSSNRLVSNLLQGISGLAGDSSLNSYTFWLKSTTKNVHRFEFVSGVFATSAVTNHVESPNMQTYASTVLVYGGSNSAIQFVSQSTVAVVKTLSGTMTGDYFGLDTLNSSLLTVASNISPAKLSTLDLGPLGNYKILISITLPEPSTSLLTSFGGFNVIGVVDSTLNLRLYQKSTLTLVGANIWTPLPILNLLGKTLFQGNSTGMRFPIHHMKTSAAIVYHRSYIEFDFCKVRTGDTCSECLPGYIKVPSGNDCFPSSTGIDLATGQLAPCSVAGCLDCSSDSKICLKCMKTSPKLYVLNNVCVPSLIKGFGPSGDKLLNCDSPDCLDCSESYKTCSFCDFLKDSHEYAGRCVRLPEMKQLHLGVDLLNFQAKPCKTSQCLDCLPDYLNCTVCDATNGYGLDGNATACQDLFASNEEERVRTAFDEVTRTITMRFRGPIDLPSVEDSVFDISLTDAGDFRAGLNCSAADSLVRVRISTKLTDTIIFLVDTDQHILNGVVNFTLSENRTFYTAGGYPIKGFPTQAAQVRIFSEAFYSKGIGKGSSNIAAVLDYSKVPMMVLGLFVALPSAAYPGYLFNLMFTLAILEGPWLEVYDGIILKVLDRVNGIAPFGNWFASADEPGSCPVTVRQYKLGLSCSFTTNFGSNIAVHLMLLVVACVSEVVCRKLAPRQLDIQASTISEQPIPKKPDIQTETKFLSKDWWRSVLENTRMPFFIKVTEAQLMQSLVLSLINLSKEPINTAITLGIMFGVVYIVYFTVMMILTYEAAKNLFRGLSITELSAKQALEDAIDMNQVELSMLAKQFGPSLKPKSLLVFMMPTANFLRGVGVAVVVVVMQGYPKSQAYTALFLQVAYLCLVVGFYSAKSPWHKWLTVWIESLFLCSLVFKLVSVYDDGYLSKEPFLGSLITVLILLLLTSALAANLFLVGQTVFKWVSSRKKAKVAPKTEAAPDTERVDVLKASTSVRVPSPQKSIILSQRQDSMAVDSPAFQKNDSISKIMRPKKNIHMSEKVIIRNSERQQSDNASPNRLAGKFRFAKPQHQIGESSKPLPPKIEEVTKKRSVSPPKIISPAGKVIEREGVSTGANTKRT